MPQIGPAEIVVVLLVGLLVFGPTRLPEMGRQVGRGLREVKKLQQAVKSELDAVINPSDEPDPTEPSSTTTTPS
jgi:TatA/E family protein of Tat protein translocase